MTHRDGSYTSEPRTPSLFFTLLIILMPLDFFISLYSPAPVFVLLLLVLQMQKGEHTSPPNTFCAILYYLFHTAAAKFWYQTSNELI